MSLMWRTSIVKPLNRLVQFGINLLFPPYCAGCGVHGSVICQNCQNQFIETNISQLLDSISQNIEQSTEVPYQKVLVWSDVWYHPPVNGVLVSLKYRPNRQLAGILARRLSALYFKEHIKADLVAVVPLGSKRLRQRGYNQVELVGRPLAKMIHLPYCSDAVNRVRETRTQVGLDFVERQENVREAFRAEKYLVCGKRILLLDDVLTTGATLFSCAQALFTAGAQEVTGLTIARAKSLSL